MPVPIWMSTAAVLIAVTGLLVILRWHSHERLNQRKQTIHNRMRQAGLVSDPFDQDIHGRYRGVPVEVRLFTPGGDESAAITMALNTPADPGFFITNSTLHEAINLLDYVFSVKADPEDLFRVRLGNPLLDRQYAIYSTSAAFDRGLLLGNTRLLDLLSAEEHGLSIRAQGDRLEIHPHVSDDSQLTGEEWRLYFEIGYELARSIEQAAVGAAV